MKWEFHDRTGWRGRLKLDGIELISVYIERAPDLSNGWVASCPDIGLSVPIPLNLESKASDARAKLTALRIVRQRAADIFSALNTLKTLRGVQR